MRIVIKGGVWKNTEDEILKVAVMKYGKNQWARISSLLTRKTPKQCKARWYEWLDPSIKKTEWSKEEDEKLLHLAKLMPTQWRTIAPIVGRTPAQCLDRYQKLLDAAEKELNGEPTTTIPSSSSSSNSGYPTRGSGPPPPPHHHHHQEDNVRRLRPGEIDPDPETKPARPDPVDMDEDEKEMLSEARARLANTQGKKAKRKARERQLEESRRLAALQKRRELKAAGIILGNKKRRSDQMDYNLDIPFQRKPYTGPYETEHELNKPNGLMFGELMLSQLEGKRKAEKEAEERKKDVKKRKHLSDESTPQFIKQSNAASSSSSSPFLSSSSVAKDSSFSVSIKRAPLHLPAPQVTEEEIQELAKLGATQVPLEHLHHGTASESDLVSTYSSTPRLPIRTPSVPVIDHIKEQARFLAQSKHLSTPLLGELDTTPRVPPATTILPLPSATPSSSSSSSSVTGASWTPSLPLPQPSPRYRDRMGINATPLNPNSSSSSSSSSTTTTTTATPSSTMTPAGYMTDSTLHTPHTPFSNRSFPFRFQSHAELNAGLAQLPKPKNDFDIVVPSLSSTSSLSINKDDDLNGTVDVSRLKDQAWIEEEQQRGLELKALEQRQLQSSIFQYTDSNLPRPLVSSSSSSSLSVFPSSYPTNSHLYEAEQCIFKEMIRLIQKDAFEVPIQGQSPPSPSSFTPTFDANTSTLDSHGSNVKDSSFVDVTLSQLNQAKHFIESSCSYPDPMPSHFASLLSSSSSSLSSSTSLFTSSHLNVTEHEVMELASQANDIEKKCELMLQGYLHRSQTLLHKFNQVWSELQLKQSELQTLLSLHQLETQTTIPLRYQEKEEELKQLKKEEQRIQEVYLNLSRQSMRLLEKVK